MIKKKVCQSCLRPLIFLVRVRIRRGVVTPGMVFGVVLVVCLTVILWRCIGCGVSLGSDWEFVEPQSHSFSKKRSFVCAVNQEEIRLRRVLSKRALPSTRRRIMPPTPQQISYFSTVASGSAGTIEYLEHSGKMGNCGNGEFLWQRRLCESGVWNVGVSDGSRRLSSLSEEYPDACKKERQQDSR